MELHHRRVIAVMRFLDDVAPPQAHRQQHAGQAEKENPAAAIGLVRAQMPAVHPHDAARSEEHTSELQSLMRISYAVFCLIKKKRTNKHIVRLYSTDKQR